MQALIHAQIDINRAVFAYNLTALEITQKKHLSFKTLEERDMYILQCAKNAMSELSSVVEKYESKINK